MAKKYTFNKDNLIQYSKVCLESLGKSSSKHGSCVNKYYELYGEEGISELLKNAIKDKKDNYPVKTIMEKVKNVLDNTDLTDGSKSSYKSGFKKFVECVLGLYKANVWYSLASIQDNLYLCQLVAKNALFASQEVIKKVKEGELGTDNNISRDKNTANPYASWDFMNHVRDTKNKGKEVTSIDGKKCIADDNTCPNHYIKQAVIESFKHKFNIPIYGKDYFKDYEACHVWDKPKDSRYYASIPNLVLLPSALAQLTDDNEEVKKMLRYRVYKLFRFKPDEETKVGKPSFYDKNKVA